MGEGLETGRDQLVCGLGRNNEVWIFSKSKQNYGKDLSPGNVCDLIYVFKSISLTLLLRMDWRQLRVKIRVSVEK